MHRRDALAALTALVPVAGCVDAVAAPAADPDDPFRDDCPSFADDADRTVCFRRDRRTAPLLLAPEDDPLVVDAGDGVVDTVTFLLRNGAARPFEFNPYGWELRRRTADGWKHVAPDVVKEPLTRLAPGQTYRWSLSADQHPSPLEPDTTSIVLGDTTGVAVDLSPGVHAFRVVGTLGGGPRVECVARFEVVREA